MPLNHVALTVGDRERSAAFYAEHRDAWSARQQPYERERPHHVPGQEHRPQEQSERE